MRFLPIVARELRVASRRRGTYLGRIGAALVPVAVAGFWLPVLASQFNVSQGKLLFSVLSTLAFAYCLLAGTRSTSDCLSGEKRDGTIGLLFLTTLKGYDVILGKLVSSSLNAFYGLLAAVPVLSLALLLGGVTLGEVGRTALLFLNTLFFSMAAGIFVSTLSRNDRRAMFATACVILLVCGGPYGLAAGYTLVKGIGIGQGPQSILALSDVLLASPIFAFTILRSSFVAPTLARDFFQSILATHLLSWFLLALASLIVPRVCRERPPGQTGLRWLAFRNRWSYGRADKRRLFRRKLLDINAFYWLAARDRIKAYYVWFFVAAMGGIWCWSAWIMKSFIFGWDVSFWILVLTFLFLKVWLASEVCTRLVEDRTSGAFELLLSSPLNLKEVAHGQALALRRQFGWPVLALLGLTYFLMLSALRSPHAGLTDAEIRLLFWSIMIMLLADLVTLRWVGMWHALRSSNVNRATLTACTRVLLLPTALFGVVWGTTLVLTRLVASGPPEGLLRRACLTWLAIGLLSNLFFGLRARWAFLRQFREVLSQRFTGQAHAPEPLIEMFLHWRNRFRRRSSAPAGTAAAAGAGMRRAWLWAVPALVLLLAFLTISWRKHSLERRVDARLAALKAAGAPVSVADLRNSLPVVIGDANAAVPLQKAAQLASFRGIARTSRLSWPHPSAPLPLDLKESLAKQVPMHQEALALLHQAVKRPHSRYPIDWTLPLPNNAPWQAFSPLQSVPDLLGCEALLHLENGNVQGAIESIQVLFDISRILSREPFLAAQVYRGQHLRTAVRAVERLLNHVPLDARQLEALAQQCQGAAAVTGPALERALAGERCFIIDEFRSPSVNLGMGPTGWLKVVMDIQAYTSVQLGIPEKGLLTHLALSEQFLNRARQVGSFSEAVPPAQPLNPRGFESWWEDNLRTQAETVAGLRAAECGLQLERFLLEHPKALPERLEVLVPGFLPELPVDPFALGPLSYRRLERGYVIYSLGRDGVDQGGEDGGNAGKNPRWLDIPFRVERRQGTANGSGE